MSSDQNDKILTSVAQLLSEGKIDAEAAGKLLNTVARFEERVKDLKSK